MLFKELAAKAFKFIGASIGVLVAAYTLGWSGAITLHSLFKAEKAEGQAFVVDQLQMVESKMMEIRKADMDGLSGQIRILVRQNGNIMRQNTEILKRLPKD